LLDEVGDADGGPDWAVAGDGVVPVAEGAPGVAGGDGLCAATGALCATVAGALCATVADGLAALADDLGAELAVA
jgi:hypothetical protein